jgi:phage baseplate assembly protein W
MIEFQDLDGAPLGTPATQRVTASGGGALFRLQFRVVETDLSLPVGSLAMSVDWDSSQPVEQVSGSRIIVYNEQRTLMPGDYFVAVEAENYRLPLSDKASIIFPVTVFQPKAQAISDVTPIIYGPMLPRDSGFPSPANYAFNRGTDIQLLESSAKMLLLTGKGERLAQPEYGTDLTRLLFETNASDLGSLIEEEVTQALTQWEPRLGVQSLLVRKESDREALVDLVLVSKLDRSTFPLTLTFSNTQGIS